MSPTCLQLGSTSVPPSCLQPGSRTCPKEFWIDFPENFRASAKRNRAQKFGVNSEENSGACVVQSEFVGKIRRGTWAEFAGKFGGQFGGKIRRKIRRRIRRGNSEGKSGGEFGGKIQKENPEANSEGKFGRKIRGKHAGGNLEGNPGKKSQIIPMENSRWGVREFGFAAKQKKRSDKDPSDSSL